MKHKPKKPISKEEYAEKIKRVGDQNRLNHQAKESERRRMALSSTRRINEPLHLLDLGKLKVQILYFPSFKQSFIWDIRSHLTAGIQVYENELLDRDTFKPGIKALWMDESELDELFKEINSLTIRLMDEEVKMGLDGVMYGIQLIQSSGFRKTKITWWEEPQEDLQNLDSIIKKLITRFMECKKEFIT